MQDVSIKWAESNDEVLNKTMQNLDRIRRILKQYSRFTIVGEEETGNLQEELAHELVVNMSKRVAWLTSQMRSSLLNRDTENTYENFVYDQSNADTLVVVFLDEKKNEPLDRVLHYCAEHLYPCLVLSRNFHNQPTVFDFPSKVYELNLQATQSQFRFAMKFLIMQATIPAHDAAHMRIEK